MITFIIDQWISCFLYQFITISCVKSKKKIQTNASHKLPNPSYLYFEKLFKQLFSFIHDHFSTDSFANQIVNTNFRVQTKQGQQTSQYTSAKHKCIPCLSPSEELPAPVMGRCIVERSKGRSCCSLWVLPALGGYTLAVAASRPEAR